MTESDSSSQNQQVTTGFLDQTQGISVDFAPVQDPNMLADYQVDAHLAKFLSRPQLIKTVVWNETDAAGTTWNFNPWHDFFNSTTTRKKLDNYAFVNCTLKVKFVVNASPFYFGSTLIAYQPMAGYYTPSAVTSGSTNAWFIPFSQMPHVWLYPQTSQGGEMKLPFFYHKNWLPLTNSDTTNMGKITGAVVNQLASANGAVGTGVTIQIWAWAEDVKLTGPTITLAIQSDEYVEENTGMISRPASSVASIAGRLTDLPIIGPFARATQIGAGAIASIASLFGFSNPPVIAAPHAFVPRPFPQFASPDISTPMEKLSIDPKNELTVDPRIAGLDGTDELLIRNIVARESYLTSCSLGTGTAVDTVIFNSLVTPNLIDFQYDGTTYMFYPTPMDHVARLFQYWRGDIIFRFRFICTAYHKGRVRITYDPIADIVNNTPDYTSVFNQVVDIGETSDVSVRVPYMQAYAWLRTRQDTQNVPTAVWHNNNTSVATDQTKDNGTIAVRIVTPITAPVASSTIYMQVFVSAADNFDVAAPVDLPNATFMTVQSDEQWIIQGDVREYSTTTSVVAGSNTGSDEDTKFLVNMGERIVSLRQLLRRTNYSYAAQIPANTTDVAAFSLQYQTIYPPWYGYDTNGRNSAKGTYTPASNFGFNYCTITPFHWIGRCFVGMRGGMAWHYNLDTTGTDGLIAHMRVFRNPNTINTGNYNGTAGSGATLTSSGYAKFWGGIPGSGGSALTNQNTCTSLQVVVPDYNYARFHWLDPASGSLGLTGDGSAYQNIGLEIKYKPTANTKPIGNLRVDKYFAVGPDFTFFFFLCAPPWTWLSSPTAN